MMGVTGVSLREESRMVRMIIALVEQEIDSKTWLRYCNNERHSLRAALPQHFWPPKGPKMMFLDGFSSWMVQNEL